MKKIPYKSGLLEESILWTDLNFWKILAIAKKVWGGTVVVTFKLNKIFS